MSYQKQVKKVPGLKTKDIMLFALSTCIWCKKTKALLDEMGKEYSFVDVDLLLGPDQEEAYNEMWKHHQGASFPTIVVNNGEDFIVGFDEKKIRSL